MTRMRLQGIWRRRAAARRRSRPGVPAPDPRVHSRRCRRRRCRRRPRCSSSRRPPTTPRRGRRYPGPLLSPRRLRRRPHARAPRRGGRGARARCADGRLPEFLIVAPDGPGQLVLRLPRREAPVRAVPDGRPAAGDRGALPRPARAGGARASRASRWAATARSRRRCKHPGALRLGLVAVGRASFRSAGTSSTRYSFMARYTLKRVFGDSRQDNVARRERRVARSSGASASRRRPSRSSCARAPRTSTGSTASRRSTACC